MDWMERHEGLIKGLMVVGWLLIVVMAAVSIFWFYGSKNPEATKTMQKMWNNEQPK